MIKKLVPKKIKAILRRIKIFQLIFFSYCFDARRYIKYSSLDKIDSENKLIGKIIEKYHVIEKGLVMPNMRFGFGQEIIIALINDCIEFANKYNKSHPQFYQAIGVVKEYKIIHDENNYAIENFLLEKIEQLISIIPDVKEAKQVFMTEKQYFQYSNSSFDKFSASRYSLRNFKGKVTLESLYNAIQLAQNAPTACNRQPVRVYVIQDKKKQEEILSIQTGNRGFGNLSDKLLIITSELGGYGGVRERNLAFIDSGIYTMNLLYALHYYKIGACTLNWCDTKEIDERLRKIINIPHSETVIVLIACGGVPENFKLTVSKRNTVNMITKVM